MWEVKKIQDFCPWAIESCHLAAARHMKLWLLNTNLFFKEPHQLTKFTLTGPLKTIFGREHFTSKTLLKYFWAYRHCGLIC